MDMKNCRGSIKLGTACGKCPRCLKSLAANIHCVSPSGYHLIELAHKGKGGCSRGKGARHVGAISARPARISVNSVVLSTEVPKDQAEEDFINARIRELLTSDNAESSHARNER